LVSEYLNDCQEDLPALYAAVVRRDYPQARIVGHRMKGTGSPYGFPSLTRMGAAIEQAAAREDALELENQVNQLGAYLASVELACG
jgi:HPt (histidine-containing phosphotransfer) domain-containing protein